MSFTAASLTVSEASGHATVENGLHQWFGSVLVDFFVVAAVIECIVEAEVLVLQELCQVHLECHIIFSQRAGSVIQCSFPFQY